MHPAELAILLHRALEMRMARFLERLEPPAWEEDPEALHQVRVSARRLGAVLDLVDPEAYDGHKTHRRTLKQLVSILGPTRELDVHGIALQALHQAAPQSLQVAALEHLLDGLDRARAKARRAMKKDLGALRLQALPRLLKVTSLANPFQSVSLQEATWEVLEPRLAWLDRVSELARREDASALHKGRVQIKKLRYSLEALEAAFGEPPETLLKPLREVQSCLGTHHDQAALEAWLWSQEAGLRNRDRGMLCGAVLDLLGTVAEDRRATFDRFCVLSQTARIPELRAGLRQALGLPPLEEAPA